MNGLVFALGLATIRRQIGLASRRRKDRKLSAALAAGPAAAGPDAGVPDVGVPDAGVPDAGVPHEDRVRVSTGAAMSPGASVAVATWYSSGWKR